MDHARFFASTPREIVELHEGYVWREEQAWEKQAWLAEQIINVSGKSVKRPVNRWALLGRQPPGSKKPQTREAQLFELAELDSEFKAAKNGKTNR